jgi:uncharacterized membrane protein
MKTTMEKLRETAIVLLTLLLITCTLYFIYSLLIWQVLARVTGATLLLALAFLKAIITKHRHTKLTNRLNDKDTRLLKFLLLSTCCIFLVIVYISYLLQSQQPAAWITFGLSLFTLKKALQFLPVY